MPKDAMAKAFGGGDAYEEAAEDDGMSEDSGLPADYESAYAEYEANPSQETFWAAVKACTEAYEGKGEALLIGMGKPKKT